MPLSAYQQPVRSKPAVDYIEQLLVNTSTATVSLRLPTKDPLWFVRAISIIAVQNLAYELQLFSSADNMGATIDTDKFIAVWQFGPLVVGPPSSPGYPFTTPDISPDNGYYHFYVDGNMIPYYDLDTLNRQNELAHTPLGQGLGPASVPNALLHTRLINRSATTKNAGTSGALQVTFYMANQGLQA